MYIRLGKRIYRVYGKSGHHYIRRFKSSRQAVNPAAADLLDHRPVRVTRRIKDNDQRLRDHISHLEGVISEMRLRCAAQPAIMQPAEMLRQLEQRRDDQQVEERHHRVQRDLEDQLELLREAI